jgi:hypothetical protein
MATLQLIKEAVGALHDRTGSSVIAINKYIEAEKKVRGWFRAVGLCEDRRRQEFCSASCPVQLRSEFVCEAD